MEKKTQTFTNIPECLVQPAPHKYETVQEILIFLRLAYFVPNKIWLKKKKKKAPNAHTHKKKNPSHQSLLLSRFSGPQDLFM